MKRCFWYVVPCMVLFFWVVSFSVFAQSVLSPVARDLQPAVVSVETYDKEGKQLGLWNGFFIGERGDIITHSNIVFGAESLQVKTAQGRVYPVTKILAEDRAGGIFRLSIEDFPLEIHSLKLSDVPIEAGEQVIVIGSLLNSEQSVVHSSISEIHDIPLFGRVMQVTESVNSSLQGCPVVTMRGEVVGIMTAQSKGGTDGSLVLPSRRITELTPIDGTFLTKSAENIISAAGQFLSGVYFSFRKDYKQALSCFEEAVKINRDFAAAYFQIGDCKNRLGNHQEAIDACKQVVRLEPEFPEGLFQLGLAYFMLKKYQKTIEPLIEAARLNPQSFETHFMLGLAHASLEQHKEAVDAYRQAIRIIPKFPEVHFHLGVAYLQLDDRAMAYEEYKILKDLNKHLSSELYEMIYQ
ncbi:MAG: tetratricopeptide repeat protein [Candidatus Brocadiaceae bacterium]|nr:tetratricopeptide repeat protein [Candidatus Brocadiaceae bacterium]